MITYSSEFNPGYSQVFYDEEVERLLIHLMACSCQAIGMLAFHASYERRLKLPGGKVRLVIARVLCKQCGKTHALLPSFIVPYSQHALPDQVAVIERFEAGETAHEISENIAHPEIDPSNIGYIVKQYKGHWKERLLSIGASVSTAAAQELALACFRRYVRQFMQIRRTPNSLFS